jgi:hypothetical protein
VGSALQTREQRALAAVGLIVALGGGWTIEKLPSEQRLDNSSIAR